MIDGDAAASAGARPPGPRIVVSDLRKRFGDVVAVDGLSFQAEPATVTGFLGPNGAGKTTTLRALLGLVRPDAGTATIGGVSYQDLPTPNSVVGAALEATGFHPARSGRAHLRVYCRVNAYPPERSDEVIERVGLAAAARRPVGGYSLGMRQRLALATALLGNPSVLILDEPANGLDPEGIAWLRHLLRHLAVSGTTVLVSSHLLAEMAQLADRVVIIDKGRCVWQGDLTDLRAGGQAVAVRTPQPRQLVSALRGGGVAEEAIRETDAGWLRVTGLDPAEVGRAAFAAGVELSWLATDTDGLESAFLELTGAAGKLAGAVGQVTVAAGKEEPA
jgi:ABC-2 type transport system ATP-binding protein